MTVPAALNLQEVQGDDWSVIFNFVDKDDEPIDYSGFTFSSTIRKRASKVATQAAVFDVDDSEAADGIIKLSLASNVTSGLISKYYYYDLQQVGPTGTTTLISGKITVIREIS